MDDDLPESGDAVFGYNLRKMREKAGMAQAALADAMRGRGRPWYQSTTGRVESGKQPATYADAVALAAIFGVTLERFRWKPGEGNAIDMLDMAADRLRHAFHETARTIAAQRSAEALAGRALDDSSQYKHPRVLDARESLEQTIEEYGPVESAVAEGNRIYESLHEGGEGDDDGGN
jgi:transcriptional regulator with XRE-family HTH domain